MHSNAHFMLSKLAAALPFGIGGIPIFPLLRGCPQGGGFKLLPSPQGGGLNNPNLFRTQTY